MSNRDEQPFRFSCQTCSAPIDILITDNTLSRVKGAVRLQERPVLDEFGQGNFVDGHLDCPVSFDKYVMGHTPFLKAVLRIGRDAYFFHEQRLNVLTVTIRTLTDEELERLLHTPRRAPRRVH
jgi:hypothetical protein